VHNHEDAAIDECRRAAASWAPTLRALGHDERLLIAMWLGRGSCTVRDLERATGMAQSLVSYHLRELREAGIVTASADGRANRYRLCCTDLADLVSLVGGLESAARQAA
jgi:DNA-binding transcriptional ArsR family regulator